MKISPSSDKTVKFVLQNVLPAHVAVGADVVFETSCTLPHYAGDGVKSTGTAHFSRVDHT